MLVVSFVLCVLVCSSFVGWCFVGCRSVLLFGRAFILVVGRCWLLLCVCVQCYVSLCVVVDCWFGRCWFYLFVVDCCCVMCVCRCALLFVGCCLLFASFFCFFSVCVCVWLVLDCS